MKPTKPFDFTDPEVLKTLKMTLNGSNIEYVGSGTSHFQSEPILYDKDGKMSPPMTDWEIEIQNNIQGKHSHIKGIHKSENSPQSLLKKEKYIGRSALLGENMFRFSLDWGRLCPAQNQFNTELMAEYVKALAFIRTTGQQPMLTLHHFTMPKFLLELDGHHIKNGGWENPDVLKHFRFYIENVIGFLADEGKIRKILESEITDKTVLNKLLSEGLVKYFMTINEPSVSSINGYLVGSFPPFKRYRIITVMKVVRKMAQAHDIAYNEIKKFKKELKTEPKVGIGHSWQCFDGIFGNVMEMLVNEKTTNIFERDGSHSDFLGLHYYFRMTMPFAHKKRDNRDYGDQPAFGDMHPAGILKMLKRMNFLYPNKEIFISEFGFADATDRRRPYWILETVRYIIESKKLGLPIKGILLWSLVNNFEWNFGMSTAKFGMFSEAELDKPMVPSVNGVHSWEVWKSVTKAILQPSQESLKELQCVYEKAKTQYDGT